MLVVEKYLGVLNGHFPTQVAAILRLVGNRPVAFVAGRQCKLSLGDVSTVFSVLSTPKKDQGWSEDAVDHDLHSMRDILSLEKMRHQPIIYVTAEAHDLRVALRLVSTTPLSQKIYMRVLKDKEIAQLTSSERTALKSGIAAGQIILLTETDSLTAYFMAHYGLKFHETTLCLPCSVGPETVANFPPLPPSKERRLRVGCLGGFRSEQGADMLPRFTRHLRAALDHAHDLPKVELIIQRRSPGKSPKGIKKSVKRKYLFWRSVGFPMPGKRLLLSFRKTNLSQEDFLATLMSVDLLLVPYRLNDYRHRGSGIILDGVAARKPIVYTKGMGMSEFLTHGNAEAALEDPKDYVDKVIRILSDIEVYRTAADEAAVELDRRIEQTASLLRSI